MRTTLDLPEELIRKRNISEIKKYKGKIELDIDFNATRGRLCRL